MSRRINCTLTDAQWRAVIDAINVAQVELEAELEYGGDAQRRLDVLDRAWLRLRDGER